MTLYCLTLVTVTPPVLDLVGAFLHQNWSGQRQNWMKAINMCTKARDFALALAILESCIKPVIFTNAWHDNLGKATHTQRIRLRLRSFFFALCQFRVKNLLYLYRIHRKRRRSVRKNITADILKIFDHIETFFCDHCPLTVKKINW